MGTRHHLSVHTSRKLVTGHWPGLSSRPLKKSKSSFTSEANIILITPRVVFWLLVVEFYKFYWIYKQTLVFWFFTIWKILTFCDAENWARCPFVFYKSSRSDLLAENLSSVLHFNTAINNILLELKLSHLTFLKFSFPYEQTLKYLPNKSCVITCLSAGWRLLQRDSWGGGGGGLTTIASGSLLCCSQSLISCKFKIWISLAVSSTKMRWDENIRQWDADWSKTVK